MLMRHTVKRVVLHYVMRLVLSIACFFTMFFLLSLYVNASETMTVEEVQAMFPDGKYWNHQVNTTDDLADNLVKAGNDAYADSVSDTACYSHNSSTVPNGKYDCNAFCGAVQCRGFAYRIATLLYGTNPLQWSSIKRDIITESDIENGLIKPGDCIIYKDTLNPDTDFRTNSEYGHTVFVLEVNGTEIQVAEANVVEHCMIKWGRTTDVTWMNDIVIKSAPENLYSKYEIGSEKNPYIISCLEDFELVRQNMSSCFELSADIDLASVDGEWEQIGSKNMPFTGVFNGNGHKIYNLKKFINNDNFPGIFGRIQNATISGLGVEMNADEVMEISNTHSYCGLVVGWSQGGSIKKTYAIGNIDVTMRTKFCEVGLLCGLLGGTEVSECYTKGYVKLNQGDYTGGDANVGGIFGGGGGVVKDCFSQTSLINYGDGDAHNATQTGGIAGDIGIDNVLFQNCYFYGTIETRVENPMVFSLTIPCEGGITGIGPTGFRISVTDCYYGEFERFNSYAARNDLKRGTVLTMEQLKNKESYDNWDFNNIWAVDVARNNGLPYLRNVDGIQVDEVYNFSEYSASDSQKTEMICATMVPCQYSEDEAINCISKKGYAVMNRIDGAEYIIPVEISWTMDFYANVPGTYSATGKVSYANERDKEKYGVQLPDIYGCITLVERNFSDNIQLDTKQLEDNQVRLILEDIAEEEYGTNTYFTKNGKPCVNHNNCLNYPKDVYEERRGEYYASQCAGFVLMLTDKVFNHPFNGNKRKENLENWEYEYIKTIDLEAGNYKEQFSDLRVGDVMLFNTTEDPNASRWEHLAMYLSKDDGGCYLYEGNVGNNCRVVYNNKYEWIGKKNLRTWVGCRYVQIYRIKDEYRQSDVTAVCGDLIGWQAIKERCEQLKDTSIHITVNSEATIPESVITLAYQKNIEINIHDDNYYWVINPETITNPKSISLKINENSANIPSDVTDKIHDLVGLINLEYTGDFGLQAKLNYSIGTAYRNKWITLYYYNESLEKLEIMGTSQVDTNGYVAFDFTHASYYVLAVSSQTHDYGQSSEESCGEESEEAQLSEKGSSESNTTLGTSKVKRKENTIDSYSQKENASNTEKTEEPNEQLVYKIIEGSNCEWSIQEQGDLTFISSADFSKFLEVAVDDAIVSKEYYVAKSGSTIITLKSSYLETLEQGKHTIKLIFTDGIAETQFIIKEDFKEGENTEDGIAIVTQSKENSSIPWMIIVIGCLICVGAVLVIWGILKARERDCKK